MATLLITLFIIVCVLLIIVVLLQKGRGGGLGAAFGGMGSSAFGTRIGDVFTWVTIVLTGLFLILAVVTSLVMRPDTDQVMAPQVIPPSGAQEEDVTVTMNCLTAGSRIHYTLDGSEPTEESPTYEKPLTIPLGKVLNARAFRTDWQPSEIVTREYTKALPATQPDTQPAGGGATAPTLPPVTTPDAPATEPVTPPATTPDETPAKKAG
jgi:protein translocase SecG subunit